MNAGSVGGGASRGPLRAVRDAIISGAGTIPAVTAVTGLDAATVEAALDHLQLLGVLERRVMGSACPEGGCATCAQGAPDGTPDCGEARGDLPGFVVARSSKRGPVVFTLKVSG